MLRRIPAGKRAGSDSHGEKIAPLAKEDKARRDFFMQPGTVG